MTFNYNRLWKLLIDKGMAKTQMRLQAEISTNILAKMWKCEPVAMESLAKIATFFCVPIWAEEKKIVPLYALFLTYLKRLSLIRI